MASRLAQRTNPRAGNTSTAAQRKADDKLPSASKLRELDYSLLQLTINRLPREPGDCDPIEAMKCVKAQISRTKYGPAYEWLCSKVPIEHLTKGEVNPILAEVEIIREVARAVAKFLSYKGSDFQEHFAKMRTRRDAVRCVLTIPHLSESARKELELELSRLRWLDAIAAKSALRQQLLLYETASFVQIAWGKQTRASYWTPLIAAITGQDGCTVARELRRQFQRVRQVLASG